MNKKRDLIDAARDPIIIGRNIGTKRVETKRTNPVAKKKPRSFLLISASIVVGFVAGLLVNRYFRLF